MFSEHLAFYHHLNHCLNVVQGTLVSNETSLNSQKDFVMTTVELKQEIHKAIDTVPDTVLVDIYEYLKQIQVSTSDKINLSRHLGQILREDNELLQRLAL